MSHVYDYSAKLANGNEASLSDYKGQVLLVVNTASKCGFTLQYKGLEKLYQDHKDAGFSVLAFPCNQFGAQEPGSAAEIRAFADKYGATCAAPRANAHACPRLLTDVLTLRTHLCAASRCSPRWTSTGSTPILRGCVPCPVRARVRG